MPHEATSRSRPACDRSRFVGIALRRRVEKRRQHLPGSRGCQAAAPSQGVYNALCAPMVASIIKGRTTASIWRAYGMRRDHGVVW